LDDALQERQRDAVSAMVALGGPPRYPAPLVYLDARKYFAARAAAWRDATEFLSSLRAISEHPAYREIVGIGWQAVPMILGELAKGPEHWGPALEAITGEAPVPPDAAGDLFRIRSSWLEWGRARGLI
jgi:hypothetical protein